MRVVIELKRGEVPEVILNNLYKQTQLHPGKYSRTPGLQPQNGYPLGTFRNGYFHPFHPQRRYKGQRARQLGVGGELLCKVW